jgi:hypothetical protein
VLGLLVLQEVVCLGVWGNAAPPAAGWGGRWSPGAAALQGQQQIGQCSVEGPGVG